MIRKSKNNQAFTIVELLVVIVVIGILAAITIVSYSGIANKAISASIQSDLINNKKLLEMYKVINGIYPSTAIQADGGRGLKSSNNTILDYGLNSDKYCLSVASSANSSIVYYISSGTDVIALGRCPDGIAWKSVIAGDYHTCAIAVNNQAYCWGLNDDGQLGNNSTVSSSVPVAISQGAMPGLSVKYLSLGDYHTCAIAENDQIYCWGAGGDGQLGNNSTTSSSVPIAVSKGAMPSLNAKQVNLGVYHTCAIAVNDQAYCWGGNWNRQLGDNSTNGSLIPVAVSQGAMPGLSVKQLSLGISHTCTISMNDQAYCWGANWSGRLGNGSTIHSAVPVAVSQGAMPGLSVKQLSLGNYHTCVIAANDYSYCWGNNDDNQLGNNSTVSSSVPVAVSQGAMPELNVKQLSSGIYHACAVSMSNQVYCWGNNDSGQLGNNSTVSSSVPVAVSQGAMPELNVKQLSSGSYHTCSIAMNNHVYCWGYNEYGELGTPEHFISNRMIPILISQPL